MKQILIAEDEQTLREGIVQAFSDKGFQVHQAANGREAIRKLEEQPFDLRACVEQAIDLLAPQASEKGLDLAYEIAEGTPEWFRGDLTRLRQVLVNLVANAVKFTERGEVFVTVESKPIEGERHEVLFVFGPLVGETQPIESAPDLLGPVAWAEVSMVHHEGPGLLQNGVRDVEGRPQRSSTVTGRRLDEDLFERGLAQQAVVGATVQRHAPGKHQVG